MFVKIKKKGFYIAAKSLKKWPHLGSNQGLDDYESSTLTNWVIGPYEFLYLKNSKNLFPLFSTSFFPSKWLRATDYESVTLTNWVTRPETVMHYTTFSNWCAKIRLFPLTQKIIMSFPDKVPPKRHLWTLGEEIRPVCCRLLLLVLLK